MKMAATAWHGYLKVGRGVLVLDFSTMTDNDLLARYYAFNHFRSVERFKAFCDEEAIAVVAMVEGYDPENEIIALKIESCGCCMELHQIRFLQTGRSMTPPQAYAALKPLGQAGTAV